MRGAGMATTKYKPFDQRVNGIVRHHKRIMAAGAETKLRKDGLIEVRAKRGKLRLPLVPILVSLALIFGLKVAAYHYLGAEEYAARLARLDGANPVHQAGLFLLEPDPATLWISARLVPFN